LCLIIAGRFKDDSDWKFGKKILGDRIQHLGWLNRYELSEAISSSKLGLLTYDSSPTNDSNSPNKKFEFSAGRLPCIATPTQANIKWSKESGGAFLAKGFEAEDIAQAIEIAITSREEWEKRSIATKVWSASFGNWSISENRLLELYRKLE
jgi:glycosyltransferase involved in cell wall biosynthesis